jgi:hypothetical protein
MKNVQKIVKGRLRMIKIPEVKNLTTYFQLMTTLLVRKIQFKKEKFKIRFFQGLI